MTETDEPTTKPDTDDNVVALRPHGAFSAAVRDRATGTEEAPPVPTDTSGATLRQSLEALLFVSSRPVPAPELAAAVGSDEETVEDELAAMLADFSDERSGIVLERVAGGWAFRASVAATEVLARFIEPTADTRLSAAALETLAIIAYTQPISRPDVARIRGVSADAAVSNLLDRGLIEEAGRSESGAMTFRTTATFERAFGLPSIAALPILEGFRPSEDDVQQLRARLEQVAAARVE